MLEAMKETKESKEFGAVKWTIMQKNKTKCKMKQKNAPK